MRRTKWSGLVAALCIALCAVLLLACSQEEDPAEAIVGTWTLQTMDVDGETYDVEDFAEQSGLDVATLQGTYTFNADGTATAALAGTEFPCTYDVDGDTVTLTPDNAANGTPVTLTYDAANGTLTAQSGTGSVTFTK